MIGGGNYVGKTSYFQSYFKKSYDPGMIPTLGPYYEIIESLNNVRFNLWDSRDTWRYISIMTYHIKIADGIILLFDLSRKEEFDNLPNLLKMITEIHEMEDFPVLLVGN